MPIIFTKYFGPVDYDERTVIRFPSGLPAFEDQLTFLIIELPATAPVVYLQSLSRPDLRFLTLPVRAIDPDYNLSITPEDLEALGLPANCTPSTGGALLCLAVIASTPDGPAANLLAPILIHVKNGLGIQAIRTDTVYSHRHLPGATPAAAKLIC